MNALDNLIRQAVAAAQQAYIPYSQFAVGSAIDTPDGLVFTGCNVENAAYPAGICAERNALFHAVACGQRHFTTIIVASRTGGSPCGICRQALYEFAPDARVICVTFEGNITVDTPLRALLPHGFGPVNLLKG